MTEQSPSPAERLIVALDVPNIPAAFAMVHQLMGVVSTFKIGYALCFDPGLYQLQRELRMRNKKFFLDAKLNDIPETVKRGVASAARNHVDYITVHSNEDMLYAAMEGKGSSAIKVMAVTALTSQPMAGSRDGFRAGLLNARIAGCDGVIMSPADLNDAVNVRGQIGNMLIATPGVRFAGESRNDHGRTGGPQSAIADGADYLIVGRPIIHADNPLVEAKKFIEHISHAKSQLAPIDRPRAASQAT